MALLSECEKQDTEDGDGGSGMGKGDEGCEERPFMWECYGLVF